MYTENIDAIELEEAISTLEQIRKDAANTPEDNEDRTFESFEPAICPSEEWSEPSPLHSTKPAVFPLHTLPPVVDRFVSALAESTQTPIEMGAILSLGVLAAMSQDKYVLVVNSDWSEPLSLFCLAIAPPAERKSAVISALTQPLRSYEKTKNEQMEEAYSINEAKRKVLEQRLQKLQRTSASAETEEELDEYINEIADIQSKINKLQMIPYRLLVDDTTPEKLTQIMFEQGGSITVCSAEGGLIDTLNGRYDRTSGMEIYLKGHAGDPVVVDRVTRETNRIESPHLSIVMAMQPTVLSALMNNRIYRGKGLCARFLYTICSSYVGRRSVSPETIPDNVRSDYQELCIRLLASQFRGGFKLSEEAEDVRKEYQAVVEQKLVGDWSELSDWAGKLMGTMLRIAALIHVAESQGDPTALPVSADCISRAIQIADYLASHAVAAYAQINADTSIADADYILRRLVYIGKSETSKRDLFQQCHSRFASMKEMEPGFQLLCEHGFVRVDVRKGKGRPSEVIHLHPSLLA